MDILILRLVLLLYLQRFKCYVAQWGWEGVSFPGSVMKVYCSTLLALQEGGLGKISGKKF